MGYTTFTGPIRAGNILNTSGVTPGVDVSNVGTVVMAQSAIVEEDGDVFTTISIPAYSQILSISLFTTVTFTNPVSVGNSQDGLTVADAVYFANAQAMTAGLETITTTTLTQLDNWINVGYPDSQVVIAGGATGGAGRGVLTITYIQGPNGNA